MQLLINIDKQNKIYRSKTTRPEETATINADLIILCTFNALFCLFLCTLLYL